MPDMLKVRKLLESVQSLAVHLTDEEISDIGEVLYRATERLLKESEG